jgi:Tol biopolymer transport system component
VGWALAVIGLATSAVMLVTGDDGATAPVYRANILPPDGTSFNLAAIGPGAAAVSPDGTRVVFAARDEGGAVRLFLRSLDQPEAHVISGTEGAQFPFWSPDSRWIAFFTTVDGTLKKVDATGGAPITLSETSNGKGGSWGADGVIVFAPSSGTEIYQVSATGGDSQMVTEIDRSRHNSHRHPRFLPDGRHFLYLARGINSDESAVMIGSLEGGDDRELLRNALQADYARDRLFFVRENTLMSQPFDTGSFSLNGEAKPVVERVLTIPAAAYGVYSVSSAGLLVYHSGALQAEIAPVWFDRAGRELERLGDAAAYNTVALARDDLTAAFVVTPESGGTFDIWTYDLGRDLKTRFTFDDATDFLPVWSPDGRSLAFASDRSGNMNIFRMGIGGVTGAEPVVESERELFPRGWSPDGRWLVYSRHDEETDLDIWAVDMDGGESRLVRARRGVEIAGPISPDGRWLSYTSDESGTLEVYVTPFPEAGRRWQASTGTGTNPFWCEGGRELVYQRFDGRVMSVEIELDEDSVRFGSTTELIDAPAPDPLGPTFAPSSDCQRFLVVPMNEASISSPLNLVVGWPQMVEER